MRRSPVTLLFSFALCSAVQVSQVYAVETFCPGGNTPDPNVIFCDGFETAGTTQSEPDRSSYYDFLDNGGDYNRVTTEFVEGGHSLEYVWKNQGDVDAGYMQLNFGKNPLGSAISNSEDFKEIYWRFYVKLPVDFVGYPSKLSRLRVFANASGAEAMIAHVWHNEGNKPYLQIDPASGVKNNTLVTTRWNDQSNLTWLGARDATQVFPKGEWVCVEGHVKMNSSGQSDGVFELYMNDQPVASRTNLDWVGTWNGYGINSVMFSNYWNGAGASANNQKRYLDAIVVSKARIGCISSSVVLRPSAPTNLNVTP